ncbi:MAG: hypothetical protein Q8Q09_00235 [Deltaproteobacteria bacterium]|nr:hypothetical protein [Deltaproteobacteria bacterium]
MDPRVQRIAIGVMQVQGALDRVEQRWTDLRARAFNEPTTEQLMAARRARIAAAQGRTDEVRS